MRTFAAILAVLALPLAGTFAAAPEISDPDAQAPVGAMPGLFPESVTAANVNAAPIPGSTLGGDGSDTIKVQFPAAGPIAWTSSRFNEGDIALSVGPFDPNDASYFPPDAFVNNYMPLEGGQAFENTTLAWRVNQNLGALLASVRHNGVDNMDTTDGTTPVGVIHGVVYFNNNFGQGWGYRMNDGVFANGGNASSDLQPGVAGAGSEAVFNTGVSYFPYTQGWLGAWVDADTGGDATFSSGNSDVSTDAVTWGAFGARVEATEQFSPTAGMLFVAPSDGDNETDIAAAVPSGDGWDVTIREDNYSDTSGTTLNNSSFQFLYVPYTAARLVGGHAAGDGSLIQSAGGDQFDLSRDADGVYRLSVFGSGETKLTGDDGTLILSVASQMEGLPGIADRSFLSYEFDDESGDFLIESREYDGSSLPLRDSDFYFAFVDFANPLALYYEADFDEDGDVDGDDFLTWQASFPTAKGATKMDGDANGDGVVNGDDFLVWQTQFGSSTGPDIGGGQGSAAIPEPTTSVLLLLATSWGLMRRRRSV